MRGEESKDPATENIGRVGMESEGWQEKKTGVMMDGQGREEVWKVVYKQKLWCTKQDQVQGNYSPKSLGFNQDRPGFESQLPLTSWISITSGRR